MEIAWITDPHLDFMKHQHIVAFAKHLLNLKVDSVLITGDISNGRDFSRNIRTFAGFCRLPIYYVLGNHDFYYTSIREAKEVCRNCKDDFANLFFLDESDVIGLTDYTALVGNSGFYDAKSGNPNGGFQMNDFKLIQDLKSTHFTIPAKSQEIAESMVPAAKKNLVLAANSYKKVYFATHVPPFPDSCWYEGKRSGDAALPWFCNTTFGDMLSEVASEYSDVDFTVLCGHTHSSGEYQHLPNLKVYTGAAEYEYPAVWKILSV